MACCNIWVTTRFNFGTSSFQYFLPDLFPIHSNIDIANFPEDKTPCLSTKNLEDVIKSLE